MSNEGIIADGLVVGVLFSSGGIGFAFQGGYEPSGESGIVTRVEYEIAGESGGVTQVRGRHIISIDGQPASEVYNRWIGGFLDGKIEGITYDLLIHPDKMLNDGGLSTFASIEEGTRLYSMKGERGRLVDRGGKAAAAAATMLPNGKQRLAGDLVVYCAGCMLADVQP